MTTAERLQGMTDRAAYEKLANGYLRNKVPSLGTLIESGINKKGETVKGPFDAFCIIGKNHFVLVEHTTDDSSLEKKWLFDRSKAAKPGKRPDGDLVKAIREATKIKTTIPSATFTVYLTTNQQVDPALSTAAASLASIAGIELKIIELSTLSDYLDHDPEGQYARKIHFGITAERLSLSLLADISQANLESYRVESFIDNGIKTELTDVYGLRDQISQQPRLLTLLQASSGMGKSTLCYQLIVAMLKSGNYALRTTPQLVLEANSSADLLKKTLLAFDSNLYFDQAAEALLNELSLFLVVDDVNKAIQPIVVLDKLIAWGVDSKQGEYKLKIICPLWPRIFEQISLKEDKIKEVNNIWLEPPGIEVCESLVNNMLIGTATTVSNLDKQNIIEQSGRDPLLLTLAAKRMVSHGGYLPNQGQDAIDSFITDKLSQVGSRLNLPVIKQSTLLADIALAMLKYKKLEPTYSEFEEWLGGSSDTMNFCHVISTERELFYFNETGAIRFRHDRVRDHILSFGITKALANLEQNIELISEPFYSDYLGLAIAKTETALPAGLLAQVLDLNPLALFCSVKYLNTTNKSATLNSVVTSIENWQTTQFFKNLPEELALAISMELSDTDSTQMQKLSAGLPQQGNAGRHLAIAGFRNGILVGAIRFLLSYPEFEPHYGNSFRDSLVSHAKQYHLQRLTKQLTDAFQKKDVSREVKKGSLLLSGYLQQESLMESIEAACDDADQNDEDMIWYYLWAAINCFGKKTIEKFNLFMDRFSTLKDEGKEESGFPKGTRRQILYYFGMMQWRLSAEQITMIESIADSYPDLMLSILGRIDHPVAIKRIMQEKAKQLDLLENHTYMFLHVSDQWDFQRNHMRLSDASLAILEEMWTNPNASKSERIVSFRTYVRNAEPNKVIRVAQLINETDADLYSTAIFQRILSGDETATTAYVDSLQKSSYNILQLHHVWDNTAKTFFRSFFKTEAEKKELTDGLYGCLSLIRRIPVADAEVLLLENWENLQHIDEAVITCLYLSTDKARAKVAETIRKSNDPSSLLQHAERVYECYHVGMASKVTLHRLNSLEPYLQLMNKHDISVFAQQALRNGYGAWMRETLGPHFEEKDRLSYLPTTKELLDDLEECIVRIKHSPAHSWHTALKHRGLSEEQVLNAIHAFALTANTLERAVILVNLLDEIGSRKQVDWLDLCPVQNKEKAAVQKIKQWLKYMIYKRSLK